MKRGAPVEVGDDETDDDGQDLFPDQTADVNTGFPEIEKDMAPSAVLPSALKCLGKFEKKLGGLLLRFKGKMTENQDKHLGMKQTAYAGPTVRIIGCSPVSD